jgi:RNA recognition motif-containing protein
MGKTDREENQGGDASSKDAKRQRKEHQEKVEKGEVAKVKKALPPGYKCNACGAVGLHAIYECPEKVDKKKNAGGGDSGKKHEGSAAAADDAEEEEEEQKNVKQVYISGLPYDMTVAKLLQALKDHDCDGVKQPFGVHLVTFEDNKQKCKGVAFVTFVDTESAEMCINKLSGISLNEAKPHLKVSCELNKRKQAKEWKPPSQARVSLNFTGKQSRGGNAKDAAAGADRPKRCYRCGGNHEPSNCHAERICYRCKSTEHLSGQCPLRKGGPKPLLPSSSSALVSTENKKIKFGDEEE